MKSKLFLKPLAIILCAILTIKGFAQEDTGTVKIHIKACADTMVRAFANGDYATMANFTSNKLVELLGGKEKFAGVMKATMNNMPDMKIERATVGNVLQVVKTEDGFQCLVEQKIVLVIDSLRVSSISPLHGYADSTGKAWKFADVGDKKPEVLKAFIPNLDKRLIIPKKVTSAKKI